MWPFKKSDQSKNEEARKHGEHVKTIMNCMREEYPIGCRIEHHGIIGKVVRYREFLDAPSFPRLAERRPALIIEYVDLHGIIRTHSIEGVILLQMIGLK